jgi:hypothetical protein
LRVFLVAALLLSRGETHEGIRPLHRAEPQRKNPSQLFGLFPRNGLVLGLSECTDQLRMLNQTMFESEAPRDGNDYIADYIESKVLCSVLFHCLFDLPSDFLAGSKAVHVSHSAGMAVRFELSEDLSLQKKAIIRVVLPIQRARPFSGFVVVPQIFESFVETRVKTFDRWKSYTRECRRSRPYSRNLTCRNGRQKHGFLLAVDL